MDPGSNLDSDVDSCYLDTDFEHQTKVSDLDHALCWSLMMHVYCSQASEEVSLSSLLQQQTAAATKLTRL